MIHTIRKKDVASILEDKQFWKQKSVPSTPQKLQALAQNPLIQEDTPILYYGTNEQKEIISYLNVVGGQVNDSQNTSILMMSSWWSHPEVKGIGKKLMLQALEDYDGKVISHLFNPKTLKIYERTNQFDIFRTYDLFYIKLDFNNNSKIQKISNQFKVLDKQYHNNLTSKFINDLENIQVNFIQEIDQETQDFLQKYYANNVLKREKESLDWMKRYPWLSNNPLQEIELKSPYFFKQSSNYFQLFYVKIYKEGKMAGFLVINVNGDIMKVGYYYSELEDKECADFLLFLAYRLKVKLCITMEENILKYVKQSNFYQGYSISERSTVKGKNLDWTAISNKTIHMGDGEFLCT